MDTKDLENVDEEDNKIPKYTLENLPPELFLIICSYLDAKFVITVLSEVCHKFKEIIDDESVWKARVLKRWPNHCLPRQDEFEWKEVCMEKEEQHRLWSEWPVTMDMYSLNCVHDATVDEIHIFQQGKLCASGARDRGLKIWDLEKLHKMPTTASNFTDSCVRNITDAHKGWIWSLTSDENYLYSAGWDGCVKFWDIRSDFTNSSVLTCQCAVLCIAVQGNVMCAGTYDKRVYLYDNRTGLEPIKTLCYHKRSVLCLALDEKHVISGSEDETVVVYNQVAGKEQSVLKLDDYPRCMSYGTNQLWLGDKQRKIHLVDPVAERFNVVESFTPGHSGMITGILHSYGSVITSSTDKTIHVLEPCLESKPIAVLKLQGEVSGITKYKSILGSSNSDCSINIWIPKGWDFGSETS